MHDMRDRSEGLEYEDMERAQGPETAGDSHIEGIQSGMDKLYNSAKLWLPRLKEKCSADSERD